MERKKILEYWPESVKAVLMASAIHNLEGSSRLSDLDGAGGIRCDLADNVVRGFDGLESHGTYSNNDFPINYTFRADYQGQTVRVVVAWDSATSDRPWETDVLNADLELKIFGPDGSYVVSSNSSDNSYEIVEFNANSTGIYTAQVNALRFDGNSEYLGFAFWKSPLPEDCYYTGCPDGYVCCPPDCRKGSSCD